MKKEFEIFRNPAFGELRVVRIDGQPWFVGKDVAGILGFKDTSKAVRAHVGEENKMLVKLPKGEELTRPNSRTLLAMNKEGLMKLVFSGKHPSAAAFQQWVDLEVLPLLGETPEDSTPLDLQAALEIEREKNRQLTLELYKKNHSGTKFDVSELSDGSILLVEFCKYISKLFFPLSEDEVLYYLKKKGVLDARSKTYLLRPLSKYVELGYFELLDSATEVHRGITPAHTPYVTATGVRFLISLFLEDSTPVPQAI